MTLKIRDMRWWDLPAVDEIEQLVFQSSPWTQETFFSELAQVPDTRWYAVAELAGSIAGYVGLMTVDGDADIQTLARSPGFARRGVGQALLDAALTEARRRDAAQVLLEVRDDNKPALELYERNGFEAVARRSNYYGAGQHAVVMRLRLRGRAVTPHQSQDMP